MLLNMEYSFPSRDIHKDIHQINSGYSGYSHEYLFLHVNIWLCHFLKKEYSCFFCLDIFFWIFQTPLARRFRPAASIASLSTFLDLSRCFQQWLASISRHACKKNVQRSSPGALQPVDSRRKSCTGSQNFNHHPHHSNLVSGFRETSLPMPGALPW